MTPSIWARCASGNDHGGGSRFRRQAGDRSHCRDESGDHTPVSPRRARQFVRDLEEGSGQQVYAPHYRAEWLAKISEAGVRRRAELYYVQFDTLAALRQEVRRELLGESRKHPATKLLRQIPSIGPIRAALILAIMQTPNRFRTKRQLWAYCGLALRTYTSGEYRFVGGQLKRSKKTLAIRGLNLNHNHDLKNIFKGAATRAAATAGPLQDFYEARVAKGVKPHLARLTLARKIAAITLLVWKKGERFDAEHLKQQAA